MSILGKKTQGTLDYAKNLKRSQHSSTVSRATPHHKSEAKTAETSDTTENVKSAIKNAIHSDQFDVEAALSQVRKLPLWQIVLAVFGIVRFIRKLFFIVVVIVFLIAAVISFAKASKSSTVTGSASATVVDDVFTATCTTLSFGKIVAGTSAGTITISPDGVYSIEGGVKAVKALAKASTCSVIGKANANYTIKTPDSLMFNVSNQPTESEQNDVKNSDTQLLVDNIQVVSVNSGKADHNGKLDSKGRDTLKVGATLHVSANTVAGVYEGVIPVMVAY